jgi:hypothetical protein
VIGVIEIVDFFFLPFSAVSVAAAIAACSLSSGSKAKGYDCGIEGSDRTKLPH